MTPTPGTARAPGSGCIRRSPYSSKGACSCLEPQSSNSTAQHNTHRSFTSGGSGITALGQGSMDYFWLSGFGQCLAPYGLSVWNLLAWTWPKLSCQKKLIKTPCKPFCNIPFCHSVPERRTRKSVSPQEVFEKSPTPQADALSSDCHCLFLRMNFLE